VRVAKRCRCEHLAKTQSVHLNWLKLTLHIVQMYNSLGLHLPQAQCFERLSAIEEIQRSGTGGSSPSETNTSQTSCIVLSVSCAERNNRTDPARGSAVPSGAQGYPLRLLRLSAQLESDSIALLMYASQCLHNPSYHGP
jgi:hypothetical protein